jgi:hypothetical protein
MTDQRKFEIIKALAYGESAVQVARAEGVSMGEVQQIIIDNAADVYAEREMLRKAGYLNG